MEHIVMLLVFALGPKGEFLEFDGAPATSMESCAKSAQEFLTQGAHPQPGHRVVAYCVDLNKNLVQEEGYVTNPPELKATPHG